MENHNEIFPNYGDIKRQGVGVSTNTFRKRQRMGISTVTNSQSVLGSGKLGMEV
jgi:hypothetical protein